mgnify:CR=1 FL=1
MTEMLFPLLGGIGLFLMGVVLLTDGFKSMAGETLSRALTRFTGTPYKAFASGTLVTLLVQSSTATTVTLVGFVSAGLLTFPQAVGVVIGASLGATGTGWVVSVLGLKISLGFYALPLIGIGALLRLLTKGMGRSLGLSLAGFGLIFAGIDTLHNSMQILAETFDLSALPASGISGYLLIVTIGTLMTVIMQSSGAAVATTLTALHAHAINFDQAALLVIGAAIGTTVTTALAAIGSNVSARRTALAHIIFNLASGIIALLCLPLLFDIITYLQQTIALAPGAISLATFHTLFILLGVILVLPFNRTFAHWIERLLPELEPSLTRHLGDALLQVPAIALESTRRTLIETTLAINRIVLDLLGSGVASVNERERNEIRHALNVIQHFFSRIPPMNEDESLSPTRVHQLHAIDHLVRLFKRLTLSSGERSMLFQPLLRPGLIQCQQALELARQGLLGHAPAGWLNKINAQAQTLADLRRDNRLDILHETAIGRRGPSDALDALDAVRWLERVTYHSWRLCYYLAEENGYQTTAQIAEIAPQTSLDK